MDGGVLLQRSLNLGRVDVGATGQDHVGGAVTQIEVVLCVEVAHVTQRLPAALACTSGGAEVAVGGSVAHAAQPHLAHLASRQRVAVFIGDQHRARLGAAHRTAVRQPLGTGDDRRGLSFGAGVQLVDSLGAQPIDPDLLQPLRARLGQVPHDAQAGEIERIAHVFGKAPDALHHRWHHVQHGALVLLDRGQRRLRIELLQQSHMVARKQRLAAPHTGAVVVERAGHHQAAVIAKEQRCRRVGVDGCRVARDNQLRSAGATARRRCLPRRRDNIGQVGGVGRWRTEAEGHAATPFDRTLLSADDCARIGQLEDGFELTGR